MILRICYGYRKRFDVGFMCDCRKLESIIIELLDLKDDVTDENSAVWFLQDLAREQDAEGGVVSCPYLVDLDSFLSLALY